MALEVFNYLSKKFVVNIKLINRYIVVRVTIDSF